MSGVRLRSLKPFRRPRLWMALWSAAIAVVVIGSLLPPQDIPHTPPGADKVQHFVAYGLLAAGAVQLFAKRVALLSACVCLALLGLALEYAQGRMGLGRAVDARDALANTAGVLIGLATLLTPLRDVVLRFDRRKRAPDA